MSQKQLRCPNCKGTNLEFMGNKRKGFSVGKAVAGGLLTSGVGVLAGFAGKRGKNEAFCKDCGTRFTFK